MVAEPSSYPGFGLEAPITSIQPGGGWGMRVELAWGRVRRGVVRAVFSGPVRRQRERRVGACPGCPGQAAGCCENAIDSRDQKYFANVCGYSFPDGFAWR